MEESLYETTILRQFAGLHLDRIPDETTILNFRRQLEKHELAGGILQVINGYLGDRGLMLRQGTVVGATIIHAPSSTKNKDGKRDPEMHQTKRKSVLFWYESAHRRRCRIRLGAQPGGHGGECGGRDSGRSVVAW
jgi:transposase, IS5 family